MVTTPNPNPLQSQTGTLANAFNYLEDAVMKAYELGAPYTSAQITIIMGAGTHYMKRGRTIYKAMN